MEKLRVAIVGCGGIANQKHMPSLKANADKAEMVAFCDIIPERAEKAAKEYGGIIRYGKCGRIYRITWRSNGRKLYVYACYMDGRGRGKFSASD